MNVKGTNVKQTSSESCKEKPSFNKTRFVTIIGADEKRDRSQRTYGEVFGSRYVIGGESFGFFPRFLSLNDVGSTLKIP